MVLVAHTPFLFTGEHARKAMLVGLASGITLGALTLHPELETIDVVELEPNMPDAARIFTRWNHDALADPRVHLIANDGRNQRVTVGSTSAAIPSSVAVRMRSSQTAAAVAGENHRQSQATMPAIRAGWRCAIRSAVTPPIAAPIITPLVI